MEQALSGVAGIDEMQSHINEGSAGITIKFVLERDINDAANDVREKVAGAMKAVPPEVLPPIVQKVDPDADPVLSLALSSKDMSLRTLTEIADKQVARSIQSVDGVGAPPTAAPFRPARSTRHGPAERTAAPLERGPSPAVAPAPDEPG